MRSLLFLTPVVPMVSGNGASMRAGMALEALSKTYRVTLLVVSQNPSVSEQSVPPEMRRLCEKVWVRGLANDDRNSVAGRIRSLPSGAREIAQFLWPNPLELGWVPKAWLRDIKAWLGSVQFDQAHVFRLSMMQIASKVLPVKVPLVLDLDDIESKALLRLTELQRPQLGRLTSAVRRREAAKLVKAENQVVSRANRVLVCSAADRRELAARLGDRNVAEMPNGIRLPDALPERRREGAFKILFVGSLDYAPNQDALEVLAQGLASHVAEAVPQGVTWRIVGRRPPAYLVEMARKAGLDLVSDAPSLDEHYQWADAVIVPLRSGGGTRIKILEAAAWQLPVVSSTIGAEGLELRHDQDLLIANTREEFSEAFSRLAGDESLAAEIARAGRKKIEEIYAQTAISFKILAIHEAATSECAK